MEAKELMIGDIVRYAGGEILRVKNIYQFNEVYRINMDNYDIHYVSPIRLTPEILEKNGFYDRNTQWYYKRFWSNGCFDIAVALDYREIEISKVCGSGTDCEEVEYGSTIAFGSDINVHELQHALRLCGLTELADSIKI